MKINNETKTGIFVVICLIAFVAITMKVGKITWTKQGYVLKAQFQYTGGVKKHAPVCLSGVEVGEIKDIKLLDGDQTLVEIDLWIRDGVRIRQDSVATPATFGLMGEKYIEIKAGSSAAGYAGEGDRIKTAEPFRMEELVDIGKKVAGDISQTAKDISTVTRHVDEIVVENRPKISGMMDNFGETSENFREFSDDVKYHPWKVLMKGKEVPKAERERARLAKLAAQGKNVSAIITEPILTETPMATKVSKSNFAAKRN